jgi:hypothetical protein
MRKERIEWFSNRIPVQTEITNLLEIGVFLPLLDKGDTGQTTVIIRF